MTLISYRFCYAQRVFVVSLVGTNRCVQFHFHSRHFWSCCSISWLHKTCYPWSSTTLFPHLLAGSPRISCNINLLPFCPALISSSVFGLHAWPSWARRRGSCCLPICQTSGELSRPGACLELLISQASLPRRGSVAHSSVSRLSWRHRIIRTSLELHRSLFSVTFFSLKLEILLFSLSWYVRLCVCARAHAQGFYSLIQSLHYLPGTNLPRACYNRYLETQTLCPHRKDITSSNYHWWFAYREKTLLHFSSSSFFYYFSFFLKQKKITRNFYIARTVFTYKHDSTVFICKHNSTVWIYCPWRPLTSFGNRLFF